MDIHDKDTCLAGNSGAANADIKIEVRDKAANAIAKAGADKDNDIADDGISIVDNSENAKNHHFVGDSEVKQLMREHCQRGGAIFFSTHVLEVAEKLCDKVAIIKGGRLIRSGTMEEVKGDDSLEEVFLELEGESC